MYEHLMGQPPSLEMHTPVVQELRISALLTRFTPTITSHLSPPCLLGIFSGKNRLLIPLDFPHGALLSTPKPLSNSSSIGSGPFQRGFVLVGGASDALGVRAEHTWALEGGLGVPHLRGDHMVYCSG